MKSYGYYVQCPACGKVVYSEHGKLTRVDEPAPCCGASGEIRMTWPSLEVHKFLEIVATQDLNSNKERPIAIVFLCTALELLLEQALWKIIGIHTRSEQLAESVLDSYRGRQKRIQLYDRLSDCPLDRLFKSRNMTTFLDEWNQLSQLRNEVVHGRYYTGGAKEADLIRSVHGNCLKAFAEVHNDVLRIIEENAVKTTVDSQPTEAASNNS